MEITLKVKPEVLKNKANSITSSIETIEKDFKEIEEVIQGTKKYWEGDASDTHQKQFSTINKEVPEIIKRLKEHPKDLLQMAGLYEAAENANQQLANALPGNVLV